MKYLTFIDKDDYEKLNLILSEYEATATIAPEHSYESMDETKISVLVYGIDNKYLQDILFKLRQGKICEYSDDTRLFMLPEDEVID